MMHNMYRDYVEGNYIPDIQISRREDNGHFVAEAAGLRETHHDQDVAVSKLTERIQDGLLKGEIHP